MRNFHWRGLLAGGCIVLIAAFGWRFLSLMGTGRGIAEPILVLVRLSAKPAPSDLAVSAQGANGLEYLPPLAMLCACRQDDSEPPDPLPREDARRLIERTYACNNVERPPEQAVKLAHLGACAVKDNEAYWTASMGPRVAGWLTGLKLRVQDAAALRSVTVYVGARKFFFTREAFFNRWRVEPGSGAKDGARTFLPPDDLHAPGGSSAWLNRPPSRAVFVRAAREAAAGLFSWALPWLFNREDDGINAAFLARRTTLASYLGRSTADKVSFLNSVLGEGDRVFYIFNIQRVYTKPQLLQAVITGAPSIYLTDSGLIMSELRKAGINYLCFDYMTCCPGDVISPIFEPGFFARHFEYVDTGLPNFFLFRIRFDGLSSSQYGANICKIASGGFYSLLYTEAHRYAGLKKKIKANPYPVEKLLNEYEKFGAQYAR
ncbi:MAG: hypothetical protein GX410_03955 [Elusimicrobia bacterium]|nr:hypothetical protein [Elusimicrobiota bacterium]